MSVIRRCIQTPDGHIIRTETTYIITWAQELQSAQEKQIPILSWLLMLEPTLLQIQPDILQYGTSSPRQEPSLWGVTQIGSSLPMMRWTRYVHQELYPSVTSTFGPLLRTAPTTLGTGAVAIGATTSRKSNTQCSLFGLSNSLDPCDPLRVA